MTKEAVGKSERQMTLLRLTATHRNSYSLAWYEIDHMIYKMIYHLINLRIHSLYPRGQPSDSVELRQWWTSIFIWSYVRSACTSKKNPSGSSEKSCEIQIRNEHTEICHGNRFNPAKHSNAKPLPWIDDITIATLSPEIYSPTKPAMPYLSPKIRFSPLDERSEGPNLLHKVLAIQYDLILLILA